MSLAASRQTFNGGVGRQKLLLKLLARRLAIAKGGVELRFQVIECPTFVQQRLLRFIGLRLQRFEFYVSVLQL